MTRIKNYLLLWVLIAIAQIAQATSPVPPPDYFRRTDYTLGNMSINGRTIYTVEKPGQHPWSMMPNEGNYNSIQEYCNGGSFQRFSEFNLAEFYTYLRKVLPTQHYLTCPLNELSTLNFSSGSYKTKDTITYTNNYWCPRYDNTKNVTKLNYMMTVTGEVINPYMKLYNQQNELIAEGTSLSLTPAQQLKTLSSTYLTLKVYPYNGYDALCEMKIYGSSTNKVMVVKDATYVNGTFATRSYSTTVNSNSSNSTITITDCKVNAFELTLQDTVQNISGTVNGMAFTQLVPTTNPKVVWAIWPQGYVYTVGSTDVVTIYAEGKPYTYKITNTDDKDVNKLLAPVITAGGCDNTNPQTNCTVTMRNISYAGWDKVNILNPGIGSYTGVCFDSKNNANLTLTVYKNYCRKDFEVDAKPITIASTLKPQLQLDNSGVFCPSSNVSIKITNHAAYNGNYYFYASVGGTAYKFTNDTIVLNNPVIGTVQVYSQTKDMGCVGAATQNTLKYYPVVGAIPQPNNVTACQGAVLPPIEPSTTVEGLAYYMWIAKDSITGKSDTVISNSFAIPTDRATVKHCRLVGIPFCNVYPPYSKVEKIFTITINALPAAITLTAEKEGLCNGEKAILTASDATLKYEWFGKNGKISEDSTFVLNHVFAEGFDTVYAIGTNSNGCSAKTNKISIEAISSATNLHFNGTYSSCPVGKLDIRDYMRLNGTPLSSNINSTIANGLRQYTFSSNKNGLVIDSLNWQINMGESYSNNYQLYLHSRKDFTTKPGYCDNLQDSIQIVVELAPNPFTITSDKSGVLCNEKEVSLSAAINGANIIWMSNNNEILGGQGKNYTHSLVIDSTISYQAKASFGIGCQRLSTNSIEVERIFSDFNFAFITDTFNYCQSIAVADLSSMLAGRDASNILNNKGAYQTFIATDLSTSGNNLFLTNVQTYTPYTVTVEATEGRCKLTKHTNILVHGIPTKPIIAGVPDGQICAGTVNLSANSDHATSYVWYQEEGLLEDITTKDVELDGSFNTYYTVSGYNDVCGEGGQSDPAFIDVFSTPEVYGVNRNTATAVRISLHSEELNTVHILLTNQSTGATVRDYDISFAGDKTENITGLSSSTAYYLTLSYTTDAGCSGSETYNITTGTGNKYPIITSGAGMLSKKTAIIEKDITETPSMDDSPISASHFDYQLYPNPAKDKLTINLNTQAEYIQMMNMYGVVVVKENLAGLLTKELDLSRLNAGTYFVGVFNGSKMVSKKLVIIK